MVDPLPAELETRLVHDPEVERGGDPPHRHPVAPDDLDGVAARFGRLRHVGEDEPEIRRLGGLAGLVGVEVGVAGELVGQQVPGEPPSGFPERRPEGQRGGEPRPQGA